MKMPSNKQAMWKELKIKQKKTCDFYLNNKRGEKPIQ